MGDNITNPPYETDPTAEGKGKGRAEPQDVSMGEEESSSDEETGAEEDVCSYSLINNHISHSFPLTNNAYS